MVMDNETIIITSGLSYCYSNDVMALAGINLQVQRGSIYGFVGPDGSGKTTMLRLLLGLLPVQQGSIRLFGQSLHKNRTVILKRVGSLIEAPSLYGHLTATENLEVYRGVYDAPKKRVGELLKLAGLQDMGRKVVKKFSLSMKQRLAIALALLPKPELLVLDEPTNGLDPQGSIEVRELIRKLNKIQGMTILISSSMLAEVETIVSHVGVINGGQLVFQGTLQQLQLLQEKQSIIRLQTSNNEAAYKLLEVYLPERKKNAPVCL